MTVSHLYQSLRHVMSGARMKKLPAILASDEILSIGMIIAWGMPCNFPKFLRVDLSILEPSKIPKNPRSI